jgi:hypothetical protein
MRLARFPKAVAGALCALIIVAAIIGCKEYDIMADMMDFERKVAGVLASARGGDVEGAIVGVKTLRMDWDVFRFRYAALEGAGPGWANLIGAMDAGMEKADAYANRGLLEKSGAVLAEVPSVLRKLRSEGGIEYVPDLLADFGEKLGVMLAAAADGQLTREEREAVRDAFREAQGIWEKMDEASLLPYGLTRDEGERVREYVGVTDRAMDRVKAAVKSRDEGLLVKALRGVEPGYRKVAEVFAAKTAGWQAMGSERLIDR